MIRSPFEGAVTTVRRDPPGTVIASRRVGGPVYGASNGVLNTTSVPLGTHVHSANSRISSSRRPGSPSPSGPVASLHAVAVSAAMDRAILAWRAIGVMHSSTVLLDDWGREPSSEYGR